MESSPLADLAQRFGVSVEDIEAIIESDPELAGYAGDLARNYFSFAPRGDRPDLFDQQSSYVDSDDAVAFMIAGNGCLAADQKVYDPVAKTSVAISERVEPFHVWSRTPQGDRAIGLATPGYQKGVTELFRVTLDSGEQFVCTAQHRVLASHGFQAIGDLKASTALLSLLPPQFGACRLPSSRDISRQAFPPGARHSFQTLLSSRDRCFAYCRPCDERLQSGLGSVRAFAPQQVGAGGRSLSHWPLDVADIAQGHSPTCRSLSRHSKSHFAPQPLPFDEVLQFRIACKTNSASFDWGDTLCPFQLSNTAAKRPTPECRQSLEECGFQPRTIAESDRLARESVSQAWGATPLFSSCDKSIIRRIVSVEKMGVAPFYDIGVFPWKNYELAGVIHHNSGKTECSAYKCAQYLLHKQPPPRKDTPFWVLTNTMHVAGEVLWKEKLKGNGHLPACEIDWNRISWDDKKADHPKTVPLLPWPEERGGDPDKNWQIEFKSFEMGRSALQAASIGGFWFSEQFPVDLFTETLVRCRDYLFPGGQFAEFTPLDPDLCVWLEHLLDEAPSNWGFYRGNTECNRSNLASGAIEAFMVTVPDELIETRLRGALATFEGAIYPGFSTTVHVVPDEMLRVLPAGCWHAIGTDWGSSIEHPHVSVFGCIDAVGDWWIYDEIWDCTQTKTTFDRAQDLVARAAIWGWPIARGMAHGREILRMASTDPHFGCNYADPSRPGEINEFAIYGCPTMPAMNRVYDGINLLRSLMKVQPNTGRPRIFIAKRCKHVIDELRKYRWRRSKKPTEGNFLNPAVAAPQPLKRDDDAVDALRYLVATFDRGRSGIETKDPASPRETPTRKGVQLSATKATTVPSRGASSVFHRTR